MYLRSDSAAGVRFLAGMQEGRGLKPSARAAGVGKTTGYRWLREAFLALREDGCSVEDAQAELGYYSALVLKWDQQRLTAPGGRRHHMAVDQAAEDAFWQSFLGGDTLEFARHAAGIGRATTYRWWQQRFVQLREQGQSARAAAHRLRVPPARVRAWEAARRRVAERARRESKAADRRAVRQSSRHAELQMRARGPRSDVEARDTRYWQLMRSGMTNTAACKILGVSRRTGTLIRARYRRQTAVQARPAPSSGRYLSLHERLRIADLLRLGCSMRAIAVELGRSPSTIKRELDRHRDEQGRLVLRGSAEPPQADREGGLA